LARPDVVWFGESLDPLKLSIAQRFAANAQAMLVIGISALVQPASLIPHLAIDVGARVIEFHLEPTTLTSNVDESILGPVGQTLPTWWHHILRNSKN
jgi:NAD-dependent SIR2 family protein deacetylase